MLPDLCSSPSHHHPSIFAHCVTQGEGLCLSRPQVSILLMRGSLTYLPGDWVKWSLCARLSDISEGGRVAGKFQEENESVSCDFLSHPAQDKQQQAAQSGAQTEDPSLFVPPRHCLVRCWIFLGWRKQFEGF